MKILTITEKIALTFVLLTCDPDPARVDPTLAGSPKTPTDDKELVINNFAKSTLLYSYLMKTIQ